MSNAWTPRLDIRTRWTLVDAREFELPPARVETLMGDAIFAVLGRAAERVPGAEPATWRVALRRSISVFDECDVAVALIARDGFSRVEATLAFDASPGRIAAVVWASQSVIGIPLGLAWRALSIRDARSFARAVFRELWSTIGAHAGGAYR